MKNLGSVEWMFVVSVVALVALVFIATYYEHHYEPVQCPPAESSTTAK